MRNQDRSLWWKRYPDKDAFGCRDARDSETPDPRLTVGTVVRLSGKPAKARKVLSVEWHRYRHRYVYEIEVSGFAYWFSDQLMLEGSEQPLVELPEPSLWEKLKTALKASQ